MPEDSQVMIANNLILSVTVISPFISRWRWWRRNAEDVCLLLAVAQRNCIIIVQVSVLLRLDNFMLRVGSLRSCFGAFDFHLETFVERRLKPRTNKPLAGDVVCLLFEHSPDGLLTSSRLPYSRNLPSKPSLWARSCLREQNFEFT